MLDMLLSMGPGVASWATFFAIFLAVIAVYLLTMYRTDQIRKRLSQIEDFQIPTSGKTSYQEEGFQVHWLKPMGEIIAPEQEWRRSEMKKLLVQAGYRRQSALYVYLGSKLVLTGTFVGLVLLAYIVTGNFFLLVTPVAVAILLLVAFISFFLPDFVLRRRIAGRQLDFVEGFPDALDLLVVCVEAGLGLDSAIQRVAQEIKISHPHLSSELALIPIEIRAGKTRREALQGLADRTDIDLVVSLVTLLLQAEQFGTSISSALRAYA
ncbi:MAG: type II secretion system F family protein, partial [Planctomycetaceae bacterium]|nr:type II secretion system F family protein [Planctomycetaceae bacterium]